MKNLPEKDFWNALKDRLGNYTDAPDDDGWDKIAGALPRTGLSRLNGRVAGIILLLTLGSVGGFIAHEFVTEKGEGGATASVTHQMEPSSDREDNSSVSSSETSADSTAAFATN